MSLLPKPKKPETKAEQINEQMRLSKREYKIFMLKERQKWGMLDDFQKGQLAALESNLTETPE